MKVISFSLWGRDSKYCCGAIENVLIARNLYPSWVCRFYVSGIESELIFTLKRHGAQVMSCEDIKLHGSLWRFLALDDAGVDVMISRDCDSRIGVREKVAVDEWLASDKGVHVMRDHPWHEVGKMYAGMWGAKCDIIKDIGGLIRSFGGEQEYGIDQDFLNKIIWPRVKSNCIQHVGYSYNDGSGKPFPVDGENYVAECLDEYNNPTSLRDREMALSYIREQR